MTDPDDEFKRDREICEAASPGEWTAHDNHCVHYVSNGKDGKFAKFDNRLCEAPTNFFGVDKAANMRFIAAARTRWPAALDEIERLRAENEKLKHPSGHGSADANIRKFSNTRPETGDSFIVDKGHVYVVSKITTCLKCSKEIK